jgi:hypothetical protein
VLQEVVRLASLAFGSFEEAAEDAVVFQAFVGAGEVNDFAHDDDGSQTALGLVIGWRHPGAARAGGTLTPN